MVMRVLAMAVLLAATQTSAIDYSVYFWPAPGNAAERSVAGVERQFAVVVNVADGIGSHSYKLLLRAFAPDGSLACETTTTVVPWQGKSSLKRVAWFEASYSDKQGDRKVRPGKYLLRAYLTEQVLPGQHPEDTNLGNNQFPLEPPQYTPVEFDVRPGAAEIRCAVPSFAPGPERR
ncbi:MAG: hypothetical protein M3041_09900 [Acidobacteriota bacterium]|nr:hypothetical protein [Acidobacteriota bacterium]